MIDLGNLKQYSLFGGLSEDVLELIKALMHKKTFKSGETIFEEGAQGDEVCFLVEGKIEVFSDGIKIGEINEGEQFGEMHMIDIMPRSANIIAQSDVIILALKNKDIFKIRRKSNEAFMMLLMNCGRDISRKLRKMNKKYVALYKKK